MRFFLSSSDDLWHELPRLPQLEGYDNFSPEELVLALSQHLPTMVLYLPLNNKEVILNYVYYSIQWSLDNLSWMGSGPPQDL